MIRTQESGLTAVELLITLFVAAAFLIAGYQLFNIVIRDGGEIRAESRANNLAYEFLRKHTGEVSKPCVTATLNGGTWQPLTVEGLADARYIVNATCPYSDTPNITKLQVRLEYGTPVKEVVQTTYIDTSKGI